MLSIFMSCSIGMLAVGLSDVLCTVVVAAAAAESTVAVV